MALGTAIETIEIYWIVESAPPLSSVIHVFASHYFHVA